MSENYQKNISLQCFDFFDLSFNNQKNKNQPLKSPLNVELKAFLDRLTA